MIVISSVLVALSGSRVYCPVDGACSPFDDESFNIVQWLMTMHGIIETHIKYIIKFTFLPSNVPFIVFLLCVSLLQLNNFVAAIVEIIPCTGHSLKIAFIR